MPKIASALRENVTQCNQQPPVEKKNYLEL